MTKVPRPPLRLIDRVVLLVAWLTTCGVVYILGFYVGRATPDRRVGLEERAVRLPVTSTPPAEGPGTREAKEFPSFYETLPAGERPQSGPRATLPSTPSTTLPTIARASGSPKPVILTVTTTTTPPPSSTVSPRPSGPPTTVRPSPPTTTPLSAPTPSTTLPPVRAGEPVWTVEASPTRSRAEAESLRTTLRQRGYDVLLVQVKRDGDTWYRLRVGRYPTAKEATVVMRRLRESEGVTHAFVASE